MTAREYISGKFATFNIILSEADLIDMSLDAGVDLNDEVTRDNKRAVEVAMCKFIPSLLLRPTSVSEGSVSFSHSESGVREYYSFLCKQYGMADAVNPRAAVTFY
jgi:hypothetical protein